MTDFNGVHRDRILDCIEQELSKIPVSMLSKKRDRRGIQILGFARIAKALWDFDDSLILESEFKMPFFNGEKTVGGAVDLAVYEPQFRGLGMVAEIVTDRAQPNDLYKLRDAPVNGGLRLLIRMNPKSEWFTINRGLALDETLKPGIKCNFEEETPTPQIWILENTLRGWRRYTFVERQIWAVDASERGEEEDRRLKIWPPTVR